MSLEITGRLIQKYDVQQVSDKFRKREFVLELSEQINGNIYTNYAKLQLVQNKCDIIDNYNIGDVVKVSFNVKGNKWVKDGKENYITSLDAWRVEYPNAQPQNNTGGYQQNQQQPYGNQTNNQNNNYNQGGNNYNQGNNQSQGNGYTQNQPSYNAPDQTDDLPF